MVNLVHVIHRTLVLIKETFDFCFGLEMVGDGIDDGW